MGALQETCQDSVNGVGVWGASKLHSVKNLASGFASEAGHPENGRLFRAGKKGWPKEEVVWAVSCPFGMWTEMPASENGYHLLASWGRLLPGHFVGTRGDLT